MTNTYNQAHNANKNKTIINLGKCEDMLKYHYNISENSSLYILKIDIQEKGMKIPKIEYEVFYPLNGSELIKLNLSVCQNTRIEILIPLQLNNMEINKYNPRSGYYNDICNKATSDYGTDISLSDRRNDFIKNNLSLCEEDCNLVEYNFISNVVKCSCLIKIKLTKIDDIKFDKTKLYKSFIKIRNLANIDKCYKVVFIYNNLKNNYGFFIYIFIYILFFICLFLFRCKYYSILINKIKKLIRIKVDSFKENKMNHLFKTKNQIVKKLYKKIKKKRNISKNSMIYSNKNPPKKKRTMKSKMKNRFSFDSINKLYIIQTGNKNINNNIKINSDNKKNLEFNNNELNSLSYEEALIYDNRTYFQYYISLLKENHLFIFSFCVSNQEYNSPIIKMFLFFFYFGAHFATNTLFFNDDTMHKFYIEKGKFDFIYQIPIILYSSLISEIISAIIKYLALSENIILEIKNIKKYIYFKKIIKNIYNKIKFRFILFFVISFLLLLFFMYYISCFCGVYVNTQIHLIKDTIISFLLSLLYPFGIFLIPGIFRIPSLRAKDKKKKCFYKFSNLLENIPI